jgi:hypothetical protein
LLGSADFVDVGRTVREGAVLRKSATVDQMLEGIITGAARSWLTIMAGLEARGDDAADRGLVDETLLSAFADSFLTEALRRLGNDHLLDPDSRRFYRQRAEEIASALPSVDVFSSLIASHRHDLPMSCELLCCMYPGWRRYLFMFDTPFDYAKRLPLSAAERADGAMSIERRLDRAMLGEHYP